MYIVDAHPETPGKIPVHYTRLGRSQFSQSPVTKGDAHCVIMVMEVMTINHLPTPRGTTAPPVRARREAADSLAGDGWRALFRRVADGEQRAIDEIYDLASKDLYGLALWRTGSPDDAADVVQEAFIRLASHRHRLPAVRNPRAWLLTVAHRLAVDVVRRRRRHDVEPSEDQALLCAPDHDPSIAVDATRASALLAQLPAKQRDVIYLRHFCDLTFKTIGRVVGVPTFTAASRYRLGIARLRRLLGGER